MLTFVQAFGMLGVPMLLVIFISMVWTAWLVCLNVAPNATANYLMNTAELDDGDFWLILDPEPVLLAFAMLCLGCVIAMYGYVVLKMTCWRNVAPRRSSFRTRTLSRISFVVVVRSQSVNKALQFWQSVTGFGGRWRKHWNTALKAMDLAIQMMTLHRILEYGFPPALCFGYAALITTNAMSCAAFILNWRHHSAMVEVLTDTVFDMLFAVGSPIVLLQYAYTHFEYDRARALLILKTMKLGSFDRQARLMADPAQVTVFLLSFDALRTTTWSGLGMQMVMNMSFCYRLKRVVEVFSDSRRTKRRGSSKTMLDAVVQAQARVPRLVAGLFLAVGVVTITYTQQAIAHSQSVCEQYPECAAYAYRWEGEDACPCLAFIDVDRAPRSYEEWVHPVDVTAKVHALATSGDLQVLSVINRRLAVWPVTLRRCTNLRHISLIYTGLEEIPEWAKTFTSLEFLAIEGKMSETNLVRMPADLFDDMAVLTNVHLGGHNHLKILPRIDSLSALNGLSLAVMRSLVALPELIKLTQLERIELMLLPMLHTLPDLSPAINPSKFTIQGSRLCCNGVIGACIQDMFACRGQSAPICIADSDPTYQMSESTRSLVDEHRVTMCTDDKAFGSLGLDLVFSVPAKEQIDKCQGVKYRQCTLDDAGWSVGHAICYNDRMQVVQCIYSDEQIAVRRGEIRLGVGAPCDPEVEAWLGCSA